MNFFCMDRAWPKEEVITYWERFGSYSGYQKKNRTVPWPRSALYECFLVL